MVTTTSLAAPTSRGEAAAFAPALVRRATASGLRSNTVSSLPPFRMLRAIGPPMTPSPMKPTFMSIPPEIAATCERSGPFGPAVHLPNRKAPLIADIRAHELGGGRLRAKALVSLLDQRGREREGILHLGPAE